MIVLLGQDMEESYKTKIDWHTKNTLHVSMHTHQDNKHHTHHQIS